LFQLFRSRVVDLPNAGLGAGPRAGTDSRSGESGDGGCHGEVQRRADHGRSQKTDFEVREEGVAQKIALFSRDELPLNVALVLDLSDSIGPFLGPLQKAAKTTLAALKAEDQVALFTFSTDAELRVRSRKTNRRSPGSSIRSRRVARPTLTTGFLPPPSICWPQRPKGSE
jgi:hypothetical protein